MLPVNFKFSQSSLQDYVDCARRFQLRYVMGQAWPAVVAEPVLEHERHLERGAQFHRLVERHQRGMDPALLAGRIEDPTLRQWWEAYLSFPLLHALEGERRPEFTLSADLAGTRLVATYDLLVVTPGKQITLFDWKTFDRRPPRSWFENRLQTRIYLFIAARTAARLAGALLPPEQIRMVYWIAGEPDQPEIIEYSAARMERDERELTNLVRELLARAPGETWPLTMNESRCRFCVYRSLCERGEKAGSLGESNDLSNIELSIQPDWDTLTLADVEESGF